MLVKKYFIHDQFSTSAFPDYDDDNNDSLSPEFRVSDPPSCWWAAASSCFITTIYRYWMTLRHTAAATKNINSKHIYLSRIIFNFCWVCWVSFRILYHFGSSMNERRLLLRDIYVFVVTYCYGYVIKVFENEFIIAHCCSIKFFTYFHGIFWLNTCLILHFVLFPLIREVSKLRSPQRAHWVSGHSATKISNLMGNQ